MERAIVWLCNKWWWLHPRLQKLARKPSQCNQVTLNHHPVSQCYKRQRIRARYCRGGNHRLLTKLQHPHLLQSTSKQRCCTKEALSSMQLLKKSILISNISNKPSRLLQLSTIIHLITHQPQQWITSRCSNYKISTINHSNWISSSNKNILGTNPMLQLWLWVRLEGSPAQVSIRVSFITAGAVVEMAPYTNPTHLAISNNQLSQQCLNPSTTSRWWHRHQNTTKLWCRDSSNLISSNKQV